MTAAELHVRSVAKIFCTLNVYSLMYMNAAISTVKYCGDHF